MIRAVTLGAAMLMLLSGCFVYDAKPARTKVINDTEEPVAVHLLGSGRVLVSAGRDTRTLRDEVCVGHSVVVSGADGEVLAGFDGAACPDTTVRLFSDGRIVMADDGRLREPLSDPPAVWPQVSNSLDRMQELYVTGWDLVGQEGECRGDGLVIAEATGLVRELYPGAVCPGTVVRTLEDGQIEVTDDGVLRAPSPDPPRTWPPSVNEG